MRDKIYIQEEFDKALYKSKSNIIILNLSIEKYYNDYGGIYSLLKDDINILCIKHKLKLFNSMVLHEQIYKLKDKINLKLTNLNKVEQGNIKKDKIKNYINKYVDNNCNKRFLKIEFIKE